MQVNMHEAKSQLSRLVELACSGEEIILAKHGDPVARIAPMTDAEIDEFLGL
jgi:prevent-host-death family protein